MSSKETKTKKNRYSCTSCGRDIITVEPDEGIAPVVMRCVFRCPRGTMQSDFYQLDPVVARTRKPTFEFFVPEKDIESIVNPTYLKSIGYNKFQIKEIMDRKSDFVSAVKKHVNTGGLMLRRIYNHDSERN